MNYQLMKFQKSYKWILVVFVIWPIIDFLLNLKEINLPLLRYLIFTIGALKIFNIYLKSNKNTQNLPVFPKIILSFCLAWLLIRYMMNISEVFIPNRNYVNLKSKILIITLGIESLFPNTKFFLHESSKNKNRLSTSN